jgi:NADH dehydrogenase (ubiquinone) Fe-S protein 1
VAFKDLLNRLGSEYVDVRMNSRNGYLPVDFRNQYTFNSKVTGIDETDLLLMVGVNPKS